VLVVEALSSFLLLLTGSSRRHRDEDCSSLRKKHDENGDAPP
jgi:hypothetical protein